ncbi:hypothetical protein IV203_007590 [Nitzschia inconspicua]|uniref:Uncharacterized protein n=1 Tax=Nitzschia inconspicua TaxID=303405 RepID=A0A9K3KF11_9STRA|nr:hypothetical protein IV203_007590 [Nitzschia inconspicua]
MFERITTDPFYVEKYQPNILSQPPEGPWVVTMENVVSQEECKKMIELAPARGYDPSNQTGEKYPPVDLEVSGQSWKEESVNRINDCPDTSKSTGGYRIFMRGGVVDNSSHLAGVVCHSSCEAEYCHATSGLMAAAFIRKVFNEILGFNSDKPLTIPLGIDSQSAMDTANSHKETSRTRHIARGYHYVRFAQMNSETTLFKVDGTRNPSNSMTKVLTADQLDEEAAIYQVEVDP